MVVYLQEEMHSFHNLHETFVNFRIEFQIAEDFFKDGIHRVGFSLSPFSDYFIMHTWLSSHFNL